MRLIQLALVFMIALLATCDCIAATNKKLLTTEDSRNLLANNDIPTKPSNPTGISATEEERQGESTTNADGTVTVSKYYNNGLKQKVQKWWNGLVGSISGTKPTRRLRQV
ncbi:RxLR effector protein [Phytophthora megakarya]|uniref:RxLR effector protein n=1 Tax=Phytophthora megakarya TaxID=4795 RepID=A0A225X4Y8_9STRA|nr:RxLR effector protein [Phytophthora megakarya]